MAILIRKAGGEIKRYMETAAGTVLEEGEILEELPQSFAEYSKRLRLSVDGVSGELVRAQAGDGTLTVRVDCPGESSIALNINGVVETLLLANGAGTLALSLAVPGMFVITPADRVRYCAAGEALCMVEVEDLE